MQVCKRGWKTDTQKSTDNLALEICGVAIHILPTINTNNLPDLKSDHNFVNSFRANVLIFYALKTPKII